MAYRQQSLGGIDIPRIYVNCGNIWYTLELRQNFRTTEFGCIPYFLILSIGLLPPRYNIRFPNFVSEKTQHNWHVPETWSPQNAKIQIN